MTLYEPLKTFHQVLFRKDLATSDQNPIILLVGRITSIIWCRATAFSTINWWVPVLKYLNINLANLFSVCRLFPWHCWAPLWPRWTCLLNWSYYLQRTEEIERRKVSLGKPSCSSSSRSIARPRRPQKSIKYVGVTGLLSLSQKFFLLTSPCSFDKLHISWNVEKRDKINQTGQSGQYFDPFLYLSPPPLWKPLSVLKGRRRRWEPQLSLLTN